MAGRIVNGGEDARKLHAALAATNGAGHLLKFPQPQQAQQAILPREISCGARLHPELGPIALMHLDKLPPIVMNAAAALLVADRLKEVASAIIAKAERLKEEADAKAKHATEDQAVTKEGPPGPVAEHGKAAGGGSAPQGDRQDEPPRPAPSGPVAP